MVVVACIVVVVAAAAAAWPYSIGAFAPGLLVVFVGDTLTLSARTWAFVGSIDWKFGVKPGVASPGNFEVPPIETAP